MNELANILQACATDLEVAGIGVDVEDLAGWATDDQRREGLFTAAELEHCSGHGDDVARRAGTWCAKEAVVKAMGSIGLRVGLRDVEILRDAAGAPAANLPVDLSSYKVRLSIAHSASHAVAVAVLVR